MGSPSSLLAGARAFARDFPRDRMPQGYLWDVVDYVPTIIDASLTGRGAWRWGSSLLTGDVESGIYAPFLTGEKLLVQTVDGRLFEVGQSDPFSAVDKGPLPRAIQNPAYLYDTAIHFDKDRTMPPRLITAPGGVTTLAAANAAHKNSPIGSVYRDMLITGGAPGEEDVLRFSVPGQALTDAASFDTNSFIGMNRAITALAALRAVIIVFHPGTVERIRGATPPSTIVANSDMRPESLFDRAGCVDPKAVAYWNDNVVFADEHGVHVTDGAVIRNLASQGGILYFWRLLYEHKLTLAACTFLDYYIVTIRRDDGIAVTLICDLNKRQWFRFANVYSLVYITSTGGLTMERTWAGLAGQKRLARVGPCFFPDFTATPIVDDDGQPVLPVLETPWYRLGQEGRKRVRFAYLSYDASAGGVGRGVAPWRETYGGEEEEIPIAPPELVAALAPVLEVGYVTSPQQLAYNVIGTLPTTDEYTRYRLPVGQFPYGVAFRVRQTQPTAATRIFDLAVEAQAAERSRT